MGEQGQAGHVLRGVTAVIGIVLGAVLVWMSFRNIDATTVSHALYGVNFAAVALAALAYFGALLLRIVRWRLILSRLAAVSFGNVTRSLVIGFAANFALPGRLGEIYRADVLKEVSSLSRVVTLGTIMVERAVDGGVLICLLVSSLVAFSVNGGVANAIPTTFVVSASVLFLAVIAAIGALRTITISGNGVAAGLFTRFREGLNALDARNAAPFAGASVLITMLELLSMALVIRSLGLVATPVAAALVLSVASLSTLLPTAPAFLGSYQFAFVLSFAVAGYPQATAVAAAFLVQLAFFVPVMLAGFALVAVTYARLLYRTALQWKSAPHRGVSNEYD